MASKIAWLCVGLPGLAAACGAAGGGPSAERSCQQRIVEANAAAGDSGVVDDAFAAEAKRWRSLDRAGCSADQAATIEKLATSAAGVSRLSELNEQAARADPDGPRHMAAFQAFNSALIAHEDLTQAERRKLSAMPAD